MPGREVRFAANLLLPLVAGGLFLLTGCGEETPTAKKTAAVPAKGHADDDHDHDDHEHHHHHDAHGPHEGALVAIGHDDAHVEFVLDADSGTLKAYILDGEAKTPVAIKQKSLQVGVTLTKEKDADDNEGDIPHDAPIIVTLSAVSPSEGGSATEYEGQADELKGAEKFAAVLTTITVNGKAFPNVAFKYPEGNEEDHHH